MFELIDEALAMLLDRTQEERDLIYSIANMDSESRMAVCLAYNQLKFADYKDEESEPG